MLLDSARLAVNLGHELVCVITSKEAPEYDATINDFQDLASQLNVPFAKGSNIEEFQELLRSSMADIALSTNYTGVIPSSIIDLFKHGILNAHGGDLPRYRGNACQAWAIINGEDKIGLCIHKMIGGELDNGDILAKEYMAVNINTRVGEVYKWIERITTDLMISALQSLEENPSFVLEVQSKDPKDALRCYPRNPSDGRIDWSNTAEEVLRLINASSEPFAGAFAEYEGEKLIIWRSSLILDDEVFVAVDGQVLKIGNGFIDVSCRNTKLRILEVEYQGVRQSPNNIIRSIRKRLN